MFTPQQDSDLTVAAADGLFVIHNSPVILSRAPRDVISGAYNLGGIVTIGAFDSIEDAKRAAYEQYCISPEAWRAGAAPSDTPFTPTEVHTPEVDGHEVNAPDHIVRKDGR